MKRYHAILLILLSLLLITGLVIGASVTHMHSDPVYTVAAVQDMLTHDPGRWAGRTILVRGGVQACPPWGSPAHILFCQHHPLDLRDPGLAQANYALPLVWSTEHAWPGFVRRLPVLGLFMPPPQLLHWGVTGAYRIQLRAAPADTCGSPPCYEALLLNAAPLSP